MYFFQRGRSDKKRLGTATVEFAVIAPVFLMLILGMLEVSRLFDTYGQFAQIARDGGRLGAMDRSDWVTSGIRSNNKIISDMRNSLAAAGYDPDKLDIAIEPAGKPGESFDLDDPNNDLDLFQVRISVPYSEIAAMPVPKDLDYALSTTVTFRNTKSTIVQ